MGKDILFADSRYNVSVVSCLLRDQGNNERRLQVHSENAILSSEPADRDDCWQAMLTLIIEVQAEDLVNYVPCSLASCY